METHCGGSSLSVEVLPDMTTDKPSLEKMESLLAKEMSLLSVEERNKALEDLHAVSDGPPEETGSFLDRALEEMDRSMTENLRNDVAGTAAYREAMKQDPSYATNPSFLIPFLRSDDYDAHAAASRVARHFQWKQGLFGAQMLARDITQDDLDVDDVRLLELGYVEALPNLDKAGRLVVLCRPTVLDESFTMENALRVLWYFGMTLAQREDADLAAGITNVVFNCGARLPTDPSSVRKSFPLYQALPGRQSRAFHVCVDAPHMASLFTETKYNLSKELRIRSRCHVGRYADFQQALKGYGIFLSGFFIASREESILVRRSMQILMVQISQRRRQLLLQNSYTQNVVSDGGSSRRNARNMDESSVSPVVDKPVAADVLFGRGNVRMHIGNQCLQELVQEYSMNFRVASKSAKTEIVKFIVQRVHDGGGRFLRRAADLPGCGHNGWIEVDVSMARDKVCKLLRRMKDNN